MSNEKLLEKIMALEIICRSLIERVKKLEQAKTFFPIAGDKHRALLNNCVDDDEAILHKREIDCPDNFTEKVMDKINKKRGKMKKTQVKLILEGRPITKKNSQRIALTKTGKRFIIQSKPYIAYERDCLKQLMYKYRGETIIDKINLQAHYYMPTKTRPDLTNLLQATCDILEKARVIEDDRNIISFDGSKIVAIDKANPRTEIIIEGR